MSRLPNSRCAATKGTKAWPLRIGICRGAAPLPGGGVVVFEHGPYYLAAPYRLSSSS
jgi:hypothetical protein